MGVDAREFPGGLLRLDPTFAYVEPPSSWPLPWVECLTLAPNKRLLISWLQSPSGGKIPSNSKKNQRSQWHKFWSPKAQESELCCVRVRKYGLSSSKRERPHPCSLLYSTQATNRLNDAHTRLCGWHVFWIKGWSFLETTYWNTQKWSFTSQLGML